MVNGAADVYVEREGRIERVPDRLFEGEEPVLHLIERIVGPLGLRVDQASPWVDARLPDGSGCTRKFTRPIPATTARRGVHAFNPPRTAIARLCRLFVSSYTLLAVILGVRSEDV